jgi:hypothetical protein
MGKPIRATEEYRDDPDAVSLHTTPDGYNYDDAPEISGFPPSYENIEGASSAIAPNVAHTPSEHVVSWTRKDHNNGVALSGGVPQVCETHDLMNTRHDTDPDFLEAEIRAFARVPPFPLIYIMGSHKETTKRGDKTETRNVTDFRIVLNLRQYLVQGHWETDTQLVTATNGENTYRGSFMKKRAPGFKQNIEVGSPEPTLREWCHRYCASSSSLRIFRLERQVLGLDETYLRNKLDGLIRSTNYRGRLSITFPIEARNIDMYTTNRINQWRLKKWICWIFYLTFLWIFTWPYLFFATKRYAVVKAQWFFSKVNHNGVKLYASVSEEAWFNHWHVGIRRLVLDKYQGEASYEQLEGVMARPADPPVLGAVNTGHGGIDNAVGILQQGIQVASAISRGDNLGRGFQGGWGYDT